MTAKEAWSIVKANLKDVDVETANELEDIYVFSVRPAGTQPGASTGVTVIIVNKSDGAVDGAFIGDPRLAQGSYFKVLDPKSFD